MSDAARHEMPFGDLVIGYDESVLTPRPWTIAQSRWAEDLLVDLSAGPVLELCSGAGHIGLAAVARNGRALVQVDDDPHACALARANADRAAIPADVREGRFEDALEPGEKFVLVVADPPWVPTGRVDRHAEDPRHAIDGGLDGLEVARSCLKAVARHLRADGLTLLQLGSTRQVEVLTRTLDVVGLSVEEVREEGDERSGGVLALLAPSSGG